MICHTYNGLLSVLEMRGGGCLSEQVVYLCSVLASQVRTRVRYSFGKIRKNSRTPSDVSDRSGTNPARICL